MKHNDVSTLITDMGATFTRIAYLDQAGEIHHIRQYPSAEFLSPIELIEQYLRDVAPPTPQRLLMAIAAPIQGDLISLSNNHWRFSLKEMANRLAVKVEPFNDFAALAASLDHLTEREVVKIDHLQEERVANEQCSKSIRSNTMLPKAVIGSGTGFGSALLIPSQKGSFTVAAEGGQALYPPQDQEEIAIVKLVEQMLHRPVTVEDLLGCQRGIPRLIMAMAKIQGQTPVDFSSAKSLLEAALEKKSPFAIEVLSRYCAMLGNVAANTVLTSGALGGLYIAGGFAPRFQPFLLTSPFREAFCNRSHIDEILTEVPTYLITHPYATLIGLKQILSNHYQS